MVLAAVLPEQWLFGFIGVAWTANPYYSTFFGWLWILGPVAFLHRADPDGILNHIFWSQVASLFLGSIVGVVFTWYRGHRPPAIDTVFAPYDDDRHGFKNAPRKRWGVFLFTIGALLAAWGAYFVRYRDCDIIIERSRAVLSGVLLLIAGLGLVLGVVIYWLAVTKSARAYINLRDFVSLMLIIITPAVNDYLVLAGRSPYVALGWTLLTQALVFVGIGFWLYYVGRSVDVVFPERDTLRPRYIRIISFLLPQYVSVTLIYLVAGLVFGSSAVSDCADEDKIVLLCSLDPMAEPKCDPSFLLSRVIYSILGVSIGLILLMVLIRALRPRSEIDPLLGRQGIYDGASAKPLTATDSKARALASKRLQ